MTPEEFDEKVRKHNAEFAILSHQEKRVAIAKDVLKQLDARRLVAQSKTWLVGGAGTIRITEEDHEKPLCQLLASQESCNVCALGGILVSAAKLANAATVNDVRDKNTEGYFVVDMFTMLPYLKNFFDESQLRLIELAFERGDGGYSPASQADYEAAEIFAQQKTYLAGDEVDDDTRLRLIMECVVRNNGTFVPKDVRHVLGG